MASIDEIINIDRLKAELWEKAAKMLAERCEAAEKYISVSPCDPDITIEQSQAYSVWKGIVNKHSQL